MAGLQFFRPPILSSSLSLSLSLSSYLTFSKTISLSFSLSSQSTWQTKYKSLVSSLFFSLSLSLSIYIVLNFLSTKIEISRLAFYLFFFSHFRLKQNALSLSLSLSSFFRDKTAHLNSGLYFLHFFGLSCQPPHKTILKRVAHLINSLWT